MIGAGGSLAGLASIAAAGCGGGGKTGGMATVDEAQAKEQGDIQDKMRGLMKSKAPPSHARGRR